MPKLSLHGILLVLTLLWTACAHAEQKLIVHPSVSEHAISINTTRLMFSMQWGEWPDGTPVRVFVLADNHPQHRAFTKNLLKLYPRQLRRVWDRQLYSGTGQSPETVSSEAEMRTRVAATPGAIGYLSSENIDESVHVLTIQ